MKKVLTLLFILTLALCLFGCGGSEKPEIDISKISDWISDTGYMDSYDYVTDWAISDNSGDVSISVVVKDGTDPDAALQVADGLVRQVSAAACNQNADLSGPTGDNYGSFYDYYTAMVGVAEQSKTGDTKDWLVFHSIVDSSGPAVELQK